ncbi:hypothetical protein GCM10025864_13780 [Luteimicrobium album]|uniref:Uncharacterized protein n=1 Tax=Luteimicrobium album TaxID=1054550 RepID=A0ABQ6HYP7_9MICO|nr:hypothetical protein GCM10025864_13780 [Luteimicrobium album]
MHARREPRGDPGPQDGARGVRVESPSSQNTSIQRACGTQASSIGPVTSATYSATSVPEGTTCAPRYVVSSV